VAVRFKEKRERIQKLFYTNLHPLPKLIHLQGNNLLKVIRSRLLDQILVIKEYGKNSRKIHLYYFNEKILKMIKMHKIK
jgi:hypothetical protein